MSEELSNNNINEWLKEYCTIYNEITASIMVPSDLNAIEIIETYEGLTPEDAIREDIRRSQ